MDPTYAAVFRTTTRVVGSVMTFAALLMVVAMALRWNQVTVELHGIGGALSALVIVLLAGCVGLYGASGAFATALLEPAEMRPAERALPVVLTLVRLVSGAFVLIAFTLPRKAGVELGGIGAATFLVSFFVERRLRALLRSGSAAGSKEQ